MAENNFISLISDYITDRKILSKVSDRLISYTGNKTMFEGIALTENRSQLEKYDIAIEVPTLQQLSVGILRKAEKDNEVK